MWRKKKAAIVRKMKGMPPNAVWLFEDETILRLLPEIRRAWSLRGEQARIPITGRNAKCVLFGTLNPQTGHRIAVRGPNMRQQYFQQFLRLLRRAYPGRQIWLVLDKAPCHTTPRSQALARSLNIVPVWLPKQWSELNGMDQLWKELKADISANVQYRTIAQHAHFAQRWLFALSKTEALRKASILSENFWLRSFLPKL
jgi:DDE superfamily endonuclease